MVDTLLLLYYSAILYFLSFYTEFLPRFCVFFFHPLGKKIFQNLIFLPYGANIFLKLNFKNLKVVLDAAEAVEATI